MTATFWTGSSLSFTNGSKIVTVNTGPSLDSVKANSSLTAGNYNEPVEVKSVSGNTITLYSNWPGSTGTTSATIKPSAAAAASAGVAAQQLITEIQGLVGSASATATANSFVKRDSNGRIKAAAPSTNDDVVNKGYLGTAARATVTTSPTDTTSGRLLKVGDFGQGVKYPPGVTDANASLASGRYQGGGENAANFPGFTEYGMLDVLWRSGNQCTQLAYFDNEIFHRYSADGCVTWKDWKELYHSGNTNFNEFGGGTVLGIGYASSASAIVLGLPVTGGEGKKPSSISTVGGWTLRKIKTGSTEYTGQIPTLGTSSSSYKCAYIVFSGLTVNQGDAYLVLGDNYSTRFTVNF